MKEDVSQKIHVNIIFPPNVSKRWSFQKQVLQEYDFSGIIWKYGIFSPENMIFFFGWKMIFLKKYMKI